MARSKKDDREDNLRLIADENEKLDLIRVNVDNVKKDVKDISVYTEKQIQAISKAIDREIKKFDELQAKVKQANGDINRETQRTLQTTIQNIDSLTNRIVNAGRAEQQQLQEISNQRRRMSEEERREREANRTAGRVQYADTYRSEVNRETQNTQQLISNISSGRLGSAFSNLASRRSNMRIANAENIMNDLTQQYKEGKISRNAFQAGIRQQTQAVNKFSASVTLFQTVGNIFQGFLDAFVKKFDDGMNRILQKYEETFTNQAVMTGISTREYQNWQNETVRQLEQQGLKNNVAISDVMETTNQFVTDGITNFTKASQMGQTAAIGKVLAPYLTQNTEAFESMSIALGPDFSKAMMGMQKYVSTETGSSRFISKNLNSIIDKMEPIVMASNKQLMGDEEWTQLEMLMQNGYTESEAMELVSEAMDTIRNPSGAISNGSTLQAMQVAAGRYTDVSQYIAGRLGDAASLLTGTTGLGRSAAAEAIGAGYKSYLQSDEQNYKQARIAAQYAVEDALRSPTGASTKRATQSFQDQMVKLANDNLQTMKALETNYLENISTYLATIVENIPTTWEVIKGVGGAIVNALLMWGIGKLLGGGGGSGILGKIGTAIGGSKAATYLGASLSYVGNSVGVAGSGAGSIAAGTATVAAPLAAGLAIGGYGIGSGINDIKNASNTADRVRGGVSIAGGAAAAAGGIGVAGGMLAAGAANAWNPVGWGLLIAGGLTVLGTAIWRSVDEQNKYNESLKDTVENNKARAKDIEAQWQAYGDSIQQEMDNQYDVLDDIEMGYKKGKNLDYLRNQLIDSGLLVEEDVNKAREADAQALMDLVQTYKEQTGKLSGLGEELNDIFKDYDTENTGAIRGEFARFMEEHRDNEDHNANYDEMYNFMVQGYNQAMAKNTDERTDTDKEIIKWYNWANEDNDISRSDINDFFTGWTKVTASDFANYFNDDTIRKIVKNAQKYGYDYGKYTSGYGENNLDDAAAEAIVAIPSRAGKSKDKAISLLKSIRNTYGYDYNSSDPYKTAIKRVMTNYGIESYKAGTSYVAADGLAFLAHEGEAVLTPAAASILRAATDSDISTVQGVSDALSTSSNLTREGFALVTSAIENQTAQLSSKIDQVISVLNNNRVVANYNSKLVNLRGGLTPDAQ